VVTALILRALVTRVPQAALDLPDPIDDDDLINVLMTCINRGFFGRAK
ncbi:MAG: putative transcriptional regulator, partial [Mycobacterium sp.]|nr:putative transcriptional regulator [Mycobacterium sp.]